MKAEEFSNLNPRRIRRWFPKKIQPYFETAKEKKMEDGMLIDGQLTCCAAHDFAVLAEGEVRRGPFSGMSLFPDGDRVVLTARCPRCGREIPVFDSDCDGYDSLESPRSIPAALQPIACPKCKKNRFSVCIRYEYSDIEEIGEVADKENAFSWIRITLRCSRCGKRYRNFIDEETA